MVIVTGAVDKKLLYDDINSKINMTDKILSAKKTTSILLASQGLTLLFYSVINRLKI